MNPDDLIAFEKPLPDNRRLLANAPAELEAETNSLLDTLAALDAAGPALADGRTILFGWSRLVIRERKPGSFLSVHEPDFFGDVKQATVPQVSITLSVLREQSWLLAVAGEMPLDVFYNQTIRCERGALRDVECYFERQEPAGLGDSGWFAGRASESAAAQPVAEEDITVMPVYLLLEEFPSAMKLLAMPAGYLGVFKAAELIALFQPGGIPVPLPPHT